MWREIESICWPVRQDMRAVSKTEMVWDFPSGGRIQFFTDENATALRGDKFHGIGIDEAARVREDTYYDVVIPTLADHRGDLDAYSTPAGRNWFFREFTAGNDPLQPQVQSFHAPTSANPLPNIQQAFIDAKARFGEDSRTFRQEWLAEFLEEGSVFRGVRAASILEPGYPERGHQYVFGIDWGRSNDYTAVSVFDCTDSRQVWLDRFTGVEFPLQLARIKGLAQRFAPLAILAEENSIGKPQIENMRRMGLPVRGFVTTNASKAQLVDHLSLQLETQAVQLLRDPVQMAELESYEAKQMASGFRYSAPDGMHDDTVMALMLSIHAGKSRPMDDTARNRITELTAW